MKNDQEQIAQAISKIGCELVEGWHSVTHELRGLRSSCDSLTKQDLKDTETRIMSIVIESIKAQKEAFAEIKINLENLKKGLDGIVVDQAEHAKHIADLIANGTGETQETKDAIAELGKEASEIASSSKALAKQATDIDELNTRAVALIT